MKRDGALEAQEQVLAVGVDATNPSVAEALGPAVEPATAMRDEDLVGNPQLAHVVEQATEREQRAREGTQGGCRLRARCARRTAQLHPQPPPTAPVAPWAPSRVSNT